MNESVGLGRIAGVRVGVNWSLLPIFALIAWSLASALLPSAAPGYSIWGYWVFAVLTTVAFYASLLAHELAHALVARRHGVNVRSIVLWVFGGVAQLESDTPGPRAELEVAAAGPAASFVLAGAGAAAASLLGLVGVSSLMVAAVVWLAGINVLLALFNLLPAFPLDGGRILRALLWRHWQDRLRATAVAAKVGRAGGFALIAVGAAQFLAGGGALSGIWLALIGWFITVAARQQPELLRQGYAVAELTAADAISGEPLVVPASATAAEVIERYVIPSRFSAFPVVEGDGRLVGLATVRRIAELGRERWATTPIMAAAAPRPQIVECSPQDRLTDVAARLESSPDRRAIVLDGARVVGILTPSDLARAVTRGEPLGQSSAAWARATGRHARARAAWGSTPRP